MCLQLRLKEVPGGVEVIQGSEVALDGLPGHDRQTLGGGRGDGRSSIDGEGREELFGTVSAHFQLGKVLKNITNRQSKQCGLNQENLTDLELKVLIKIKSAKSKKLNLVFLTLT